MVFALSIVTFGMFGMIWMVVQANWVKRVTGNGRPFGWSLAYLLCMPAVMVVAFVGGVAVNLSKTTDLNAVLGSLIVLMRLASFVLYIISAFSVKGALEAEPIDIPLGGIMTFFFSVTYFQYHLFDYSVEGKVGEQLSGFVETPQP